MGTRGPRHLETEPETPSPTTTPASENIEPRLSLRSDSVNSNERVHHEGLGYGHNLVLYRPVFVFPHPPGYTVNMPRLYTSGGMSNAPIVVPSRAQFIFNQQEQFYGNPIVIGHNLPVLYDSQGRSIGFPAAYYSVPYAVHPGNFYHPQPYGSSFPRNTNHRVPGHRAIHRAPSSHQNLLGVSLNSHQVHVYPTMNINPGIIHGPNPRANSTTSNFPEPQIYPWYHFPVPDGRALGLAHHLDARDLNEGSNRHTQYPTAGSRPPSHGHDGLYHMDLARFSRLSLTDNSLRRNPNEQNSFGIQHGHENIIRSVVPSRESSHMGNPSGIHSQAPRNQLNHFNQTFRQNTNQRASSSRNFPHRRSWTQPSNRQYKPSRGNTYSIRWEGFETSIKPLGNYCDICNGDLAFAAGNIETNSLPDVSVLHCGHVFHSECLQPLVDESSSDTPCHLCTWSKLE